MGSLHNAENLFKPPETHPRGAEPGWPVPFGGGLQPEGRGTDRAETPEATGETLGLPSPPCLTPNTLEFVCAVRHLSFHELFISAPFFPP